MTPPFDDTLAHEVRLYVFSQTAATARVPQPPQIAEALGRPEGEIEKALQHLAAGKVLILAPNSSNIWAANPFCAVPAGFRVDAGGRTYQAICAWDALGVVASLGTDGTVHTFCGECSEAMTLRVTDGKLAESEGIVHFGVSAHRWWDNIGFT